MKHQFVKVRDAHVENVEFLNSCGTADVDILAKIGLTPGGLARALEREGRGDLAKPYNAMVLEARKVPCVDCGRPRSHRAPTGRCRECTVPHLSSFRRREW